MQMKGIIVIIVLLIILLFVFVLIAVKYRLKNKWLEVELLKAQEQFRSVIGSANDAIILTDSTSTIISWNKGAQEIFGYPESEVLGRSLNLIIPKQYQDAHDKGMNRYLTTNESKVIGQTIELLGLKQDGTEFPIELSLSTWEIQHETFFSGIIRDITERKQSEEKIRLLAYHDELTKLPNRRYGYRMLEKELTKSKVDNKCFVIMMLDLNRFKKINDTYGHNNGDLFLIEIANRLKNVVENKGIASRIGGDEFTILMRGVKDIEEASNMAKSIILEIEKPISINSTKLYPTTSIGIAMYPKDGHDAETLLVRADKAMYIAKSEEKSTFIFYNSNVQ
jgi:diguanylate cyclase (GGDEF)-like protein/PAS domain S-box-containing protein